MRKLTPVLVMAFLMGCSFTQQFQLPASNDGGLSPANADAGCSTDSDPNNCGVCGHSCLGGTCAAGQCTPVVLASGQGDSAYGAPWYPFTTDIGDSLDGADRLAVDDAHVYWLNLRGELKRVPLTGGATEHVATTKPAPAWLVLDDVFVYFSTLGGELYRVAKTGGVPVRLAAAAAGAFPPVALFGGPYPFELQIVAGQITWASGKGIVQCPLAGCPATPQVLDQGTSDYRPFSFAIDASGRMYASVEDHQTTGPNTESVAYTMTTFREGQWLGLSSPSAYYELHGGAGEVYALTKADFGATGVVRWTETSLTYLASGDALSGIPRGLALDDEFAYWANGAPSVIDRQKRTASVVRCKKSGCASPEILADAQLTPRAVAVSKDAVYWTTGDGMVLKLAKPASSQRPLQ